MTRFESESFYIDNSIADIDNRLYKQIESLTWLVSHMALTYSLPPLRGWAASPDVLLSLHEFIREIKPRVVVEFGSGASTLVILDALKQNGIGKLYSFDHSEHYSNKTKRYVLREDLDSYIDFFVSPLTPWSGKHLNGLTENLWYDLNDSNLNNIDLMFVDGPPGITCKYSRYPALAELHKKMAKGATIFVDDSNREDETAICEAWSKEFSYDVELFTEFEKGLAILTRRKSSDG